MSFRAQEIVELNTNHDFFKRNKNGWMFLNDLKKLMVFKFPFQYLAYFEF